MTKRFPDPGVIADWVRGGADRMLHETEVMTKLDELGWTKTRRYRLLEAAKYSAGRRAELHCLRALRHVGADSRPPLWYPRCRVHLIVARFWVFVFESVGRLQGRKARR